MDVKIETLRTTTNVKNLLTRIKGVTGIQYWNVICRWGLCLSIKQSTLPRLIEEKLDGIEIDYDVFVGKNKTIYTQLLINDLQKHKIEITKENLYKYLYAHVNRGVSIIYNYKMKSISDLASLIAK
jgi:DNA sulfur modification protein DndE